MKMQVLILFCLSLLAVNAIAADEKPSEPIVLTLPNLTWALTINAPGFSMDDFEIAPRGDAARFQAANKATGMMLSGFLEKMPGKMNAADCRAVYLPGIEKSPFPKSDMRMSESGEKALVEYLVKNYMGQELNQKNINAYLSKAGYCIDIHLSKANFKSADQQAINEVLKGVKIDENYRPDSMMLFRFGNLFYRQKNYAEAAPFYQQALNLENNRPKLPRMLWLVLVDQLGMSYGISGSIEKAKDVFRSAIAKEPTYPMFYYNLGCAYAESNNPDAALRNLKLAYKYKENMLPGEVLPDPRTDSSFERYLKNKSFVDELNKLK